MSPLRPYTIARWGLYLGLAAALLSAWMGHNAGATVDFITLRSVFVFVAVAALAFGAEAVVSIGARPGGGFVVEPPHGNESEAGED